MLIDFATLDTDNAGYPTMKANPGGAPANFLAALTAYGCSTAFIGKVGTDTFGKLLLGSLETAGIDTRGIVSDHNVFTTLAFVTFDEHGDRTFSFSRKPGADTMLALADIDLTQIDNTKVLHFGTLSLTDEPVRTATKEVVVYGKKQGKLITFDPNLRLPLWNSLEEAKTQILWGLAQADVVKISEEEVEFLWGISPEAGADKLLQEYGVKLAMITLGSEGCFLKTANAQGSAVCPKVNPMDTTGAGDIFGGSAASVLLQLGKDILDLTQEDLNYMANFATTAASLSTEKQGALPRLSPRKSCYNTCPR